MTTDWMEAALTEATDRADRVDWPEAADLRSRSHRRPRRQVAARAGLTTVVVLAVLVGAVTWWPHPAQAPAVLSSLDTGPCAGQPPGCGSPLGTAAALAGATWSPLPASPLAPRQDQASVWTGTELIEWGGVSSIRLDQEVYADGTAFDPTTGTWRALPPSPLAARSGASAVWTGREAIIWGGTNSGNTQAFADGAAYDPTDRRWHLLPPSPLSARLDATAIWTGDELIVFGGDDAQGNEQFDGAVYQPATDRWTLLPDPPAGFGRPDQSTVAWTGRQFLVWEVYLRSHQFSTGSEERLDRENISLRIGRPTWQQLPPPPSDADPYGATTAWTGQEVLFLGGGGCFFFSCPPPSLLRPGATYDPATGSWGTIPGNAVASGSGAASQAWTGQALVAINQSVSGGGPGYTLSPGDGVVYDPGTGTWTTLPPLPLVSPAHLTVTWTGTQLLVLVDGSTGEALTPRSAPTSS